MIFADLPYFLSNGGITCHAGRLKACQRVLKPNGTIWVSGTTHIVYSAGFAMQKFGQICHADILPIQQKSFHK